jgi:16S rRNA (uracil1498-N3)-methyltransferase
MSHLFRFLADHRDGAWTILDTELHHLKRVLRLRSGDRVEVFDGQGHSGEGILQGITADLATVEVQNPLFFPKSATSIVLAVGALKPGVLEELLPFLIELGVDQIHTFLQENSAKARIHEKAQDRWQRIVVASCKQCKRSWLPTISAWRSLTEFLASGHPGPAYTRYVLSPNAPVSIAACDLSSAKVSAVLGGEMGLSPDETSLLLARDYLPISLGPNVLRAVTAAVAAAAVISTRLHASG